MTGSRLVGQVRVVGAGLLGASIGLGLRAHGVDVIVHDSSPANLSLAIDYGAGRAARDTDNPALIVVAVPPDVTATVVAAELDRLPGCAGDRCRERQGRSRWPSCARPGRTSVATSARIRWPGVNAAGRSRLVPTCSSAAPGWWRRTSGITAAQARIVEDLILDLGAVPVDDGGGRATIAASPWSRTFPR